ncbi:competence type IV pilus minor pilin ComGG [Oceanobacillus bengalensis]|uniref:Competence protein ComG n=1 Tax=Oceanobacillus bengalensis TaxID=1435466 RepID=A0A494Z0F9_9BACI|nr:competence type IV pilus minor pilin ComGG [Oceanobacillus bengalensis]RKQ16017.1 hypothetical protein D8M05_07905 [Oceanobacillus bengalensis]
MKKPSSIIRNEQGFILPYILFVVVIILMIVKTNIEIYQNELEITERQIEQIKAETLFQMARTMVIDELEKDRNIPSSGMSYDFPNGSVHVIINTKSDTELQLLFKIVLSKTQYTFEILDTIVLERSIL